MFPFPQSANYYRFASILGEKHAPRHRSNVFFNSAAQKNLGKRYPAQWRAIGIDLDQIRSRETTRGLIITTMLFYRGKINDSILRADIRTRVSAEILAVTHVYA